MYLSNNYYDYKLTVVLQKWTRHHRQPWGVESARWLSGHWNGNHSSAEALSLSWIAALVSRATYASCPLPPASALLPRPPLLPNSSCPFPLCVFLWLPPMTFTRWLPWSPAPTSSFAALHLLSPWLWGTCQCHLVHLCLIKAFFSFEISPHLSSEGLRVRFRLDDYSLGVLLHLRLSRNRSQLHIYGYSLLIL